MGGENVAAAGLPNEDPEQQFLPAPTNLGRKLDQEPLEAHGTMGGRSFFGGVVAMLDLQMRYTWSFIVRCLTSGGVDWSSPTSDIDNRRLNHLNHMQLVAHALKGEPVNQGQLMEAFVSFKEAPSQGMSKAELQAMFYFAESTKQGRKFIEYMVERGKFQGGEDAELPYSTIMEHFLAWQRQ